MASEGAKHDGDKPQFSLLWDGMPNALLGVAKVLTFGAKKYAAHSWQTVPNNIERYQAALLRHQNAIARGEIFDDESGLPHDLHVACNSLFLAELRERERLQRPDHGGAGHGQPGQSTQPVRGSDGGAVAGEPEPTLQERAAGVRSTPVLMADAFGLPSFCSGQHTPVGGDNGTIYCIDCGVFL